MHVRVPASLKNRQSLSPLHWTQLPVPSHTWPLLSLQAVPIAVLFVPHVLPDEHVLVAHVVFGVGQSLG